MTFYCIRSVLASLFIVSLSLGLLTACGGGGGGSSTQVVTAPPSSSSASLSGAGQKGIFLAGSIVEAFPLDAVGVRAGTGVSTQTDANGQYTLTLSWTGWTEIQVSGQYFDEYNGNNSSTALTLQGITNIGSAQASSNVNLFTHMVASRIRTLAAGGANLADASNTAHAALRQTFGLSAAVTDAGALNLTDGNSSFANENAALLRFSGSFQAVGGNAVESVLQNLTNDFTNNGQFDGLGQAEFNNIRAVAADPATTARLRENLRERGFDNPPAPPNDDSNDPGWGTPNHAPIATAAIINATEDTPKTFTLAGTDADTDTLTFVDVSTPNHGTVSVNPNTGAATYTPAANFSGEDSFTFKVFDRLVKSATATVTVNVAAVDDLPTVANPIADLAVNEDAASRVIDLSHVFQDADGDAITLTVQNNTTPTLVSPSLNGTNLTLAFATNRNGTATITIRATANGQTVDDSFTVTVNPEEDAPVVANPITDVTTTEDASDGSINLNNVFADGDGDSITLGVQGNTNSALVTPTLNGTTLTLDYLPDAYGTADITIRATAGGLSVDDTFRVTVSAVDDAPRVANSIADVLVNEDAANTSISLGNVFSDPENDSITLSIPTNTNAALVTPTLNGTTLTLAYAADGYGSANITVRATANGKMVEDTFAVTVNAVSDAPTANAGENFSVYENTASVALNCLGTDTDSDTLTYAWTAPNGITLSGADTATATFNAPRLTTASIDLTFTCAVSDGTTTVTDSVNVTMRDDIIDPIPTGWLNDTGVITWGNATDNSQLVLQPDYPGQDADFGRDIDNTTNDSIDGYKGFSFTKIGATGRALETQSGIWSDSGTEAAGTNWSCVKDNNTGLIWEVKTNDNGLHDKDWSYTWYEPSDSKNGGNVGSIGSSGTCNNTIAACNTNAYVNTVNQAGWCGATDWRLPTIEELYSIISIDREEPAIDSSWFPNTPSLVFWSDTPYAMPNNNTLIWVVNFRDGSALHERGKSIPGRIRLVRSSQ